MRAALPVALLVLAGLLYRERGEVVQPLRPPGTPRLVRVMECRQESPMWNEENRAEAPQEPEAQQPRPQTPSMPVTSAVGPESLSVAPPLLAQLEHVLKLDTTQISYLVRILREREAEIRDCHERYRRMGVLDIRDYEWWVAERKSLWFRRVDAVLDPAQHELWTALQGRNPLGQGLEFEVSEGMAILE